MFNKTKQRKMLLSPRRFQRITASVKSPRKEESGSSVSLGITSDVFGQTVSYMTTGGDDPSPAATSQTASMQPE